MAIQVSVFNFPLCWKIDKSKHISSLLCTGFLCLTAGQGSLGNIWTTSKRVFSFFVVMVQVNLAYCSPSPPHCNAPELEPRCHSTKHTWEMKKKKKMRKKELGKGIKMWIFYLIFSLYVFLPDLTKMCRPRMHWYLGIPLLSAQPKKIVGWLTRIPGIPMLGHMHRLSALGGGSRGDTCLRGCLKTSRWL